MKKHQNDQQKVTKNMQMIMMKNNQQVICTIGKYLPWASDKPEHANVNKQNN